MKPKIFSWDVQGLNERDKRMRVKNLLREWKTDIVYL
jgi:exonuclease III